MPPESGRAQKVAFLAKDGAILKQGDPVAEFDPYDAQKEAADGQADLTAAGAKIDKAKAEGTKNEKSLGLDRDVAREELDRAETYKLTDEGLFSRHQIIESQLDRDLFAARADVAGRKLDASGKLSSAERALGEIDAGKARLKVEIAEKGLRSLRIAAPHDGLLVLERNWRGETPFVGDSVWPGQKIAELPDLSQLEAKVFVLEADGAGLKAGLEARLVDRGPARGGDGGHREPGRAARQDARLPVPGEVLRGDALARADRPLVHEARPEGPRGRAPRGGRGRHRHPARRGVREGRQARRLPAAGQGGSPRSRS